MKAPASRPRGRPPGPRAQLRSPGASKRREAERHWLIPPALLGDPGGPNIAEIGILDEHPRVQALLIWNVVRDLMLWAGCPEEKRPELFPPESARVRNHQLESARLQEDAATWLELLMGVIYGLSDVPRPGFLSDLCERLAGWAAPQGKIATAIGFAQGGALAEPMVPRAARLVGELAARSGQTVRAESWYQRAVGIARRRQDWSVYASSFQGMGELAFRRGALAEAQERFRRGLLAARRNGFRPEQADGCIGMLRVAVERGRFDDARRWESRARRLVRRMPEKLQDLAAASVELWMHVGDYARALEGLEILRLDASGERRMYVLARIAHASAGIGDLQRLMDAWTQAWALAHSSRSAPRRIRYRTFIELHRAAARRRDSARAARALTEAAKLAQGSVEETEVRALRQGGAVQNGAEPTIAHQGRSPGEPGEKAA